MSVMAPGAASPARADATPRIAVIAPNWLGDAVMALPAIEHLGARGRVVVLAPSYVARVFWKAPGVAEVWSDVTGGRWRRTRSRSQALRHHRAEWALVMPPSFSAALAPALAGVKRRAGFIADGRRVLLNVAAPLPPRSEHLSDSYRALAVRLSAQEGIGAPSPPRLHVGEEERASIRARLAAVGVGGDYAVLVPGAAFGPAKAWPAERYRALCVALAADLPVILSGGAGDRALTARVAEGLGGVVDLAGQTTLGEFFALAEVARVLVANDSGAPHVSAALGTPTVVLFGSTSPTWTAPRGGSVQVLQHKVHCNPCFRRTCPTQLECFNGIDVAAVEAAARSVLAGGAGTVRA
jgi:heptosyltransferase-2